MAHSNYGSWLAEYVKSGRAACEMKTSIDHSCAKNKVLGLDESNAEIEAARKREIAALGLSSSL